MVNIAEIKKTNRRRAPRKKPRGFVKLECRKGSMGLGQNLANVLLDVSETGARLVLTHELAVAQEVEVVFSGYGLTGPIKRLSNVRWLLKLEDGKFCMGVEFQKRLDFRDLQSLASLS